MKRRRTTRRRFLKFIAWFGVTSASNLPLAVIGQNSPATRQSPPPAATGQSLPPPAAAWLTLPPTPKLPPATRDGIVSVNGTSIFYAQFGSGPDVLLLHGGLANSNYWGHQIKQLAQQFSVTVMDTRGHGRSPVMSHSFSYRLFAQDVIELLGYLKIPKTSIVGWSDGAITGLQLAMTKPDVASRLFAFGANSSLDGLKANGARSGVFATYSRRCRSEYALLSPRPERWNELMEGLRVMWRSEPRFTKEALATIRVPTAISDGQYDEIIKREHTEHMAFAIPGAKLFIQPAVSHFAMLQNPAQFNQTVIEFLKGET
jgi:pimeloyl-ACP methyl ester carboxylesterase